MSGHPPPPGDVRDIIWFETLEAGAWTVTWTNGLGVPMGVDSSVAEDTEAAEPEDPTDVTFPPGTELPEDYILVEYVCTQPIPAISHWGMIVMTLLVVTAGAVILIRRRVRTAA